MTGDEQTPRPHSADDIARDMQQRLQALEERLTVVERRLEHPAGSPLHDLAGDQVVRHHAERP